LAGLRDLVRFEPSRGIQLPAWLDRLVSLGIVTTDSKVARRHKIVNVASYAAALNSMSRVLAAPIHEQLGLVGYLRATSGALFVAALLINRLHRYGENTAAMGMVVWFLISISFATLYYGSTYFQVYFVLIGVLWFLFGLENWRTCLLWTGVVLGAALIVLFYAPNQGIAIAGDPRLVTYVALQSMINAILIVSILIVYALLLLQRAERDLERQSARAEALLSVVLPADVANRLRASPDKPIADRIDGVSILFADLEGFTTAAHTERPEIVVAFLNRLVSAFDATCEQIGVEKIKSIGDAYMAAAGLDGDCHNGAVAVGRLGLAMIEYLDRQPSLGDYRLRLRIGIHTGTAVAGVIGDTRISYDLWGDAVNIASRMESRGIPGRIHVSESYRAAAGESFVFGERGETEIKGIGAARTYFLVAAR
jgi:adenylate cyclase